MSPKIINFLLIILNISLAVGGQFAIKAGMNQVGLISSRNVFPMLIKSFMNSYVVLGVSSYVIATFVWIIVLSRVELSYAYPMLSLGYIFIVISSILWLGEALSLPRILGTLCIIGGVFLIFRS